MADSYLEFSEVLTQLTDEETDWLKNQLEIIHLIDGKEVDGKEVDEPDAKQSDVTWSGCRAYVDLEDYEGYGDLGFGYEFEDDLSGDQDRRLWFYTEDYGYVDGVAHLVQKFLKEFRPDQSWSLTYSITCSKPRIGEFGGGAVVVTATDIKWFNSWEFVETELNKLNNGRS